MVLWELEWAMSCRGVSSGDDTLATLLLPQARSWLPGS